MKWISHRGNLIEKNEETENTPSAIDFAIGEDFEVEVDLRGDESGQLYLGHDEPQTPVTLRWLKQRKESLWVHCKDEIAFHHALWNGLHCFVHENDPYTMTSWGYVWAYPRQPPVWDRSIQVLPELLAGKPEYENSEFVGVCSDIVALLREDWEQHGDL